MNEIRAPRENKYSIRANKISKIAYIPYSQALFYWFILIIIGWLAQFLFLALLNLFFSPSSFFVSDFGTACSEMECARLTRSESQGWVQLNDNQVTYVVRFPRQRPSGTSSAGQARTDNAERPTSSEQTSRATVTFMYRIEWDSSNGAGLTARASTLETRPDTTSAAVSEIGAWTILSIGNTNILNLSAPSVTQQLSAEFIEASFSDALSKAARSNSLPAEEMATAERNFRAGLVSLDITEIEDSNRLFVRRVISGPIQSITFIILFVFIQISITRYYINIYRNSEIMRYLLKTRKGDESDTSVINRIAYPEGQKRNEVISAPRQIAGEAHLWLEKNASLSEIPSLLSSKADSIRKIWETEYQPLKYLIWLIPTVGFIGTIVGIGLAMIETGGLASTDNLVQSESRGAVSSRIGLAFDTTLLALILSACANLIFHDIYARENSTLSRSRDFISNIISKS